ncbi:glycosyltransferase [Flavisolibacter nicotianae]|uniref:glycosyltransferase n=1 Tax=Flavisolibacter nicotianae TaxID=2364882 RepID=UPI000EAD0918|nr:glycosyltransferase [Flavisolibacter nicotianae]
MKRIYFTVTNDLTYDQRMHRICTSLAHAGYDVTLVGREWKHSLPLQQRPFAQKRLRCLFNKSFLFYAEYNLRLLAFLLTKKMDAICAIDLDTILPGLFISRLKQIPRIYDAHEYFTELKEVRVRPLVKGFWTKVERFAVPKFDYGYTVSDGLAAEFQKKYGRNYPVIRNLPMLQVQRQEEVRQPFLVYQGAVNEARGFEYLIPAMKKIPYRLVVCGDGNYMNQLKQLIREQGVESRVELRGMLLPDLLRDIAAKASLGIGLAEKEGINQFHALPNKFLEYMHAGLPQIAMNFPEYQKINRQFKIAVLLDDLTIDGVAEAIHSAMDDQCLLADMHENAVKAREIYCWQNEEKHLLQFYQQLFS